MTPAGGNPSKSAPVGVSYPPVLHLPGWRLGQARRAGAVTEAGMTSDEERDLKLHLERLRQEHRDLDAAIEALTSVTGSDVLQVQRLKKRKLQLKDRISHLEDELFPDIIA